MVVVRSVEHWLPMASKINHRQRELDHIIQYSIIVVQFPGVFLLGLNLTSLSLKEFKIVSEMPHANGTDSFVV